MKRVVVESPYAGDVVGNVRYARMAIRDCLQRGEAPIASHLLFTQQGILRDELPEERALGIEAGLTWMPCAELVAVYVDRGLSRGMLEAIARAKLLGIPVQERRLMAPWSGHDIEQAYRQGWCLSNDSLDRFAVARVDDPAAWPIFRGLGIEAPVLESDADAHALVASRATIDPVAAKAMLLVGSPYF